MKIGLITPPESVAATSLADLVELTVQAEAEGFDSFWFVQLPAGGCDVLTAIALAGQRTSRIELGTGVVPTYPRHPLVMAQQALTTQVATNGRLTLGLGLSHQPVIEGMMGLSYDRPAGHMREYLSVLGPLMRQEPVSHSGDFFNVNASMVVPGAPTGSIVIAALAPLMLQIAGEPQEDRQHGNPINQQEASLLQRTQEQSAQNQQPNCHQLHLHRPQRPTKHQQQHFNQPQSINTFICQGKHWQVIEDANSQ